MESKSSFLQSNFFNYSGLDYKQLDEYYSNNLKSLLYFFPSLTNPYDKILETHSLDWAIRYQLITTESAYQSWQGTKFSCLVASVYPNAKWEHLKIIAHLTIYMFMFSDVSKQLLINNQIKYLKNLHEQLLKLLIGKNFTIFFDSEKPWFEALEDIRQDLQKHTTSEWFERFFLQVERFFQAWQHQNINHINEPLPILNKYLKFRETISGFCLGILLIEINQSPPKFSGELAENQFKYLILKAKKILTFWHDIVSFKKSRLAGNIDNLIWLLQGEGKISLDLGRAELFKLWNQEVKEFVHLEEQLIAQNSDNPHLKQYLTELRHCLSGYLNWTLESERYFPTVAQP